MKNCLSIAGSDCSGGAGIQADLKTFSALRCYGMSVITSVVAENTSKVVSVYNLPAKEVENQIDAVFEDIRVDGVKLGMLPTVEIIKSVAEKLKQYKPKFIVCDPVLVATSGDTLSGNKVVSAYKKYIFPIATIITPNIPEAEAFTGLKIKNTEDMKISAQKFIDMGANSVLVKGGHLTGDAVDILFDGKDFHEIRSKRIDSNNTHGTGCTLSSAITAFLANGCNLAKAVKNAKSYLFSAIFISNDLEVGKGHGPVNHFWANTMRDKLYGNLKSKKNYPN